jgi:hypothetical protein
MKYGFFRLAIAVAHAPLAASARHSSRGDRGCSSLPVSLEARLRQSCSLGQHGILGVQEDDDRFVATPAGRPVAQAMSSHPDSKVPNVRLMNRSLPWL